MPTEAPAATQARMVLVFGAVVFLVSLALGIYTLVAWSEAGATGMRNPYALTVMAMGLFALAGIGLFIDGFTRLRRKQRESAAWARTIGSSLGPERYVERLVEEVRERQAQDASLPTRRAALLALSEDGIVGKRLRRYLIAQALNLLNESPTINSTTTTTASEPHKKRLHRRESRIDAGYGKGLYALWYVVGGLGACLIALIVFLGGLRAAFIVGVVMTVGLVTWAVAVMLFDQIISVDPRHLHASHGRRRPLRRPKHR